MKQLNVSFSQRGLAYFPDFAIYSAFHLGKHDLAGHRTWQQLAKELDAYCAGKKFQTVVLLGVGFELWTTWSRELGYALPKGMGSKAKLNQYSSVFANTGGDLWFHIKSDSPAMRSMRSP
jgi:deferrochelatase/peroxidase EfeB